MDEDYAALYRAYSARMYVEGCRLTPDADLVWDVIQTVFLNMMREAVSLAAIDNKAAYLQAAFHRTLFRELGRRHTLTESLQRMRFDVVTADDDDGGTACDDAALVQRRHLLASLLHLSPHQQLALHQRYVKGMQMETIAEELGMNTQSAANLIHRSIVKLRADMAQWADDHAGRSKD